MNSRPSLANGANGPSASPWRQTPALNNLANRTTSGTNSNIRTMPPPDGINRSMNNSLNSRLPPNSQSVQQPDNLPTGAPLNDLVSQLEDYHPTIPDAVTSYYVNRLVNCRRRNKFRRRL